MLQQAGRFGSYLPQVGVGQSPPVFHMLAEFIDDGIRIISLPCIRKPLRVIGEEFCLVAIVFPFLRLRDRRNELSTPAALDNLLGRLSLGIKLPVLLWARIRRIQDRAIEKWIGHR